jgi:hypothetical protein
MSGWLPSAGYQMQEREDAYDGAGDVDGQLDDVGPDDCGHTAFKGVDEGEECDDGDGGDVALEVAQAGEEAAECNADNDGYSEDTHAFRGCAGDEEQARGERSQSMPKRRSMS